MFAGGPSGFYNAPVLKSITFLVAGLSLVVNAFGYKKALSIGNIVNTSQLWRLFPSYFFFSSPLEAALGILFLYHFRIFERQMGSAKFAAFVVSTCLINNLMSLAFIVLVPTRGIASGPYGLIFSLLTQYYFEVPSTYRFRIFGFSAGDKLLAYLLSLQLLGTQFPASLVSGLSGIVAGIIYRSEILFVGRLTTPAPLAHIAQRWLLPLLQQPPRRIPLNVNLPNIPQHHRTQQAIGVHPPESAVAALMDMGFSREEAQLALTQANNDPELAAALLLDH